MRSYYVIAITALLMAGFGVRTLYLNPHTMDVFKTDRSQPKTTDVPDGPANCPAAAAMWCETVGGLPE
jgi:hypothetical protein